jgi:hypothetical protein
MRVAGQGRQGHADAAGESAAVRAPSEDCHAVALQASAADLAELPRKLQAAGVQHVTIVEPDPPYHGALLAIGIVPGEGRARKLCSRYKLVK